MDNISNDAIPVLPSFRDDPEQDWGPSDFDVRHTVSGGADLRDSDAARTQRGARSQQWSVDAVFAARSALPVNVVTGAPAFGVSNALRPDVVPGVPLYVDDDTVPGGGGSIARRSPRRRSTPAAIRCVRARSDAMRCAGSR